MLAAILERCANTKASFGFNGAGETVLVTLQFANRNIENSHLHSAGNVDSYCVGNDGVFGREYAAYWQAIADMSIGHEGSSHRHREEAGSFHLHDGFVFKAFSPLTVFDRFGSRRWS